MKHCPLCESQYTDETLSFCLQDGTVLTENAKQSSIDTIAFSHPITSDKIMQTEEMRVKIPDETQSSNKTPNKFKPYFVNPVRPVEKKKSTNLFLLLSLPILVIVSGIGIGIWFYFDNQNQNVKQTSNNVEKNLPVNASVASTETVLEKTTPSPQINSNDGDIKKEVTDIITTWQEAFKSKNITEYTNKYAETVDYYEKTNLSVKEVHSETQKVFNTYTEIELELSNILVAVDIENNRATAIFDKEWTYETGKDLSEGKTHTKLQFEKKNNEWKIISEKNLKTYYLEN